MDNVVNESVLQKITRKDIREAAVKLTDQEARYLVDYYYIMQDDRKRAHNQVRSMAEEPNMMLSFLSSQAQQLEETIKKALDDYTKAHKMGSWMRSIYGIGPVISAGLLAHIDIEKAPTVGHIWRFGGVDPTMTWNKGEKRPWNAALKTLFWKTGQSFMKFSGQKECFYGKLYKERKAYEVARNDSGANSELAATLASKFGKATEAYGHLTGGKLPPAQIDARARRYAVKIFLSHMHAEWYRRHFNQEPPKPFAIAILGHAHMMESPI